MSIFSLISTIFEPAAKLIDNLHTSDDEKMQGQAVLKQLENTITAKIIDYETQLLESQSAIITSESKSEHWITSNWRPITALVLVFIVFNNYILYPYLSLFIDNAPLLDTPPDLWDLIKLCLSGYIASRGIEKGIKEWKK